MKKTYIQPSVKAHKIEVRSILSGSPSPNFNPGETFSTMDARGGWFDEDEE